MKFDICIVSKDKQYAQWMKLVLLPFFPDIDITDDTRLLPSAKKYCVDTDGCTFYDPTRAILYYGEDLSEVKGLYCIQRPFGEKELISACMQFPPLGEGSKATPDTALLFRGRHIRLSETEHAIYTLLAEAEGSIVSREDICQRIWSVSETKMLNLYIHYLRKKLETDGKKAIISHRGKGYSLAV